MPACRRRRRHRRRLTTLILVAGLATPLAGHAQLDNAVALGVGFSLQEGVTLPLAMVGVRFAGTGFDPAALRLDGTLAADIGGTTLRSALLNAQVPLRIESGAATPYVLVGAGVTGAGAHYRATAGMGLGLLSGSGAVRLFIEGRALYFGTAAVTGAVGLEF